MIKIRKLKVGNLRNDEHAQANRENIALLEKYGPEVLEIKSLYDGYVSHFEAECAAIGLIRKSDYTRKLIGKDNARDRNYKGLFLSVCAALYHPNPLIGDAARRLKILFDAYGNISRKPINEQTSATSGLVKRLRSDKHKDDAALLQLEIWIDEMHTLNKDFQQLMAARDHEKTEKPAINLLSARKAVDKSYRAIVERINALIVVNGADRYLEYVKAANVTVNKYSTAIKSRSRSSASS